MGWCTVSDMDTPCTLWTGRLNEDGYGTIGVRLAHRAAWEGARGPIPPGLELDHLCRVRSCIALDHLEPVTKAENRRRAEAYRVLKETCVNGHTGEHRQGRDGKRYCKACKREKARLRPKRSVGDPCGKGHLYDRETGKGVRCSTCMSELGKANMAKRWHGQ